jgi:beta-xylosidase
VAVTLALLVAAVLASAAGSATYTNPVFARDFPDPFVLHYGGLFYAYATESGAKGFQVAESTDLVHWTHRGLAFTVPWSREHYWAPEVIRWRGKYHMTYSARNPATGKHDIGIAVANQPLGPFEHKAVLVRGDDNRIGVIDATVFLDRDKTPYLVYSEEEPRRIVMRRLAPDLLSADTKATELIRPDRPWELGITEAPTMILRDGIYHLIYSAGSYQGTKADCRYVVAHASSRSLRGPYVKTPEPILAGRPGAVYGPGHQCVVRLPGDKWWLVYHGWDDEAEPHYGSNPRGRTMRIDPLTWHAGAPAVDGPSTAPREAPAL